MTDTIDKGGRPALTTEELETILRKLQPYLENGMSIHKSCVMAGVPSRTVFDQIEKYEWFSQRIEAYKAYKATAITDVVRYKVDIIRYKINLLKQLRQQLDDPEKSTSDRVLLLDQIEKLEFKGGEVGFIQWLALNDKSLRDEFGAHTELTGKDGAPLSQVLDKLEAPEKTDYGQLGQAARRQMVAINAPIQNQDQIGGASNVPTEHNAVETPSGESGTQPGTVTQS